LHYRNRKEGVKTSPLLLETELIRFPIILRSGGCPLLHVGTTLIDADE